MTESAFLNRLREAIRQNDGRPPGESSFYRDTGLNRKALWDAGFESYGAACKAVGCEPNTLKQPFSDTQLFRPLALLTRTLGRFPPKGAIEVQRGRDPSFPSWEAFIRRVKQGPAATLRGALTRWCEQSDEFSDILGMLRAGESPRALPRANRRTVNGYVYLMRYGVGGKIYKVGKTESVERRHAQIDSMAPQDVRVVHSIPTDDPDGIERYWLARFEERRVVGKKELFQLTLADVAAFRSRSYQ